LTLDNYDKDNNTLHNNVYIEQTENKKIDCSYSSNIAT